MKKLFPILFLLAFALQGCFITMPKGKPDVRYSESPKPPAPDYSRLQSWAAHPGKIDNADRTPFDTMKAVTDAPVDVFFIHPTIFTYKPKNEYQWNGDVNDEKLNDKTDRSTILFQASVFNGAGNVYAPRYRQAHLSAFYTSFKADRDSALAFAYRDVKNAFEYYLTHWNNGKPFIIASHSQGTVHAARLIHELIDGKPLQKQLVAAYLIGMPVPKKEFQSIAPCENPDDIGCVLSWCTYARDYYPDREAYMTKENREALVSTNPLTWKTDDKPAPYEANTGGVGRKIGDVFPGMSNAQNHEGMLWIDPPQFTGSAFFRKVKNFHIADYNLFYLNIRANAVVRAKKFLENGVGN